jgi:hypothetical protein
VQGIPDVTIPDLIVLTLLIAIGFLLAVAFYETLSTRDVLVRQARGLAARLSGRRWVRLIAYLVTVLVGIPLLVLVWTLVLDTALFVLSPIDTDRSISLVAVSVVGAARVLAYANERVAHELAKALPLALLFLLLTGGNPDLEAKMAGLEERNTIALTRTMLVFLLSLEVGLRILNDASKEILAWSRRRRGIDSDLGVWRSGASAVGLDQGDAERRQ